MVATDATTGRFVGPMSEADYIRRFWSRFTVTPDGCWEWTGARNPNGYGRVGIHGSRDKTEGVHRLAWMMVNGRPVPVGMRVLHRCDNPPCGNPDHLRLGTQQENLAEMRAKGRGGWPGHKGVEV